MAKTLKIIMLLLLVMACTKDTTYVSPFTTNQYSALLGTWEWDLAFIEQNESFKSRIEQADSSFMHCSLAFNENGLITETINGQATSYKLEILKESMRGADFIFTFRNSSSALVNLSYSSELDRIRYIGTLFNFAPDNCNTSKAIFYEFKTLVLGTLNKRKTAVKKKTAKKTIANLGLPVIWSIIP